MGRIPDKNIFASFLKLLLLLQIASIVVFLAVTSLPDSLNWFLFSFAFLICIPNLIIAFLALRKAMHLPTRKGKTTSVLTFIIEIPTFALLIYGISLVFEDDTPYITPAIIILFLVMNVAVFGALFILLRSEQKQSPENVEVGNKAVEGQDSKPHQKRIWKLSPALALAGAIIIAGIAIVNIIPSKNEQRAISAVNELRTILKDPDSLKIRGDILVFNDGSGYCVVFKYSATNSYGGAVSNVAYFCELGYIGDNDTDINDISSSRMQDRLIDARIFWTLLQTNSVDTIDNGDMLSGSRIAKKAGCTHSDY